MSARVGRRRSLICRRRKSCTKKIEQKNSTHHGPGHHRLLGTLLAHAHVPRDRRQRRQPVLLPTSRPAWEVAAQQPVDVLGEAGGCLIGRQPQPPVVLRQRPEKVHLVAVEGEGEAAQPRRLVHPPRHARLRVEAKEAVVVVGEVLLHRLNPGPGPRPAGHPLPPPADVPLLDVVQQRVARAAAVPLQVPFHRSGRGLRGQPAEDGAEGVSGAGTVVVAAEVGQPGHHLHRIAVVDVVIAEEGTGEGRQEGAQAGVLRQQVGEAVDGAQQVRLFLILRLN